MVNQSNLLNEIIEDQINKISYHSSDFTIIHKSLAFKAIKNLLKNNPQDMVDYLINKKRTGGFQHKIFQEYIKLLESSFPIYFNKCKMPIKINSLLDPNLSLFDGISEFNNIINDKLEIKNNTQEIYIGGRKGANIHSFYIGKLLNVISIDEKESLLDKVEEYSFSKIKMKNIMPGLKVKVIHLRIPPHYQMGGMVYVNRARKEIVDCVSDHEKINS